MDFAGNHALRFNFDATFGENHAIEPPGNHDAVPFNLALDFGTFAKDDRLLRDDVPFHVPVNAERASDRERALERDALVDEPCPFFAACALWWCARGVQPAARSDGQPNRPAKLAAHSASGAADLPPPKELGRAPRSVYLPQSTPGWLARASGDALRWRPSRGPCRCVRLRLPG